MTEHQHANLQGSESLGLVAPLLPPTAPMPEPARRVNFFKAFALFWLLPKRYGPYLAAGSFRRAFAAHVLALLIAVGVLGAQPLRELAASNLEVSQQDVSLHMVRVVVANTVLQAAADSTMASWSWLPVVSFLGAFPAIQIGVLLLATLAMPWVAGGDRTSSVWKRSVKNVYWCTTFLVPASIVFIALNDIDLADWTPYDGVLILGFLVAIGAGAVVLARMLTGGAHRYVGQADGPAFAPREAVCDRCGYAIVHLPLDTVCSECGLPVRDSLPGGRRQPTEWHEHELRPRGLKELIRLQWVIFRDPTFFDRLPVQSGISTARHFWWATFVLMGFTALLVLRVVASVVCPPRAAPTGPLPSLSEAAGILALYGLPVLFLLQAAVMFVACLWAQVRLGARDYRVSATVCYYASPLLWPLIPIAIMGAVILSWPVGSWLNRWHPVSVWEQMIGAPLLVAIVLLVIAVLLAISFLWRRLRQALTATRYANI